MRLNPLQVSDEAESIAMWLRQHSEKGGRMVLHSIEGDGNAWGWEFDGRARMRGSTIGQPALMPFPDRDGRKRVHGSRRTVTLTYGTQE